MKKGYMYILRCNDDSYYTGSTSHIEYRLHQHQNGQGANYTKKRLPVKLVYLEEFDRIDEAFYREKQIQGWRREKKEALIKREYNKLPELAKNASTSSATNASTSSATNASTSSATTKLSSPSDTKVAELVEATEATNTIERK